jgi:hypothetical protein
MSRTQVDRIRKLHKAFVSAWSALQVPDAASGQSLFLALLGRHDDEVIDLDLLHRDAVNELSVSADCDVQHAAMIYGAAINGRELGDLAESVSDSEAPDDEPLAEAPSTASPTPKAATAQLSPPVAPTPSVKTPFPRINDQPTHPAATPREPPAPAPQPRPLATGQSTHLDDLRHEAFQLADAAAQMLGCDDIVRPIGNGLGFLVDAVPAEVRESLPINQRPALLCAWWLLVTVSEQFASHGLAERAIPESWENTPVGEAMTKATQVEHWQSRMAREKRAEALLAVPYMPASNYAAYGLHRVTTEFFDTWTALLTITRQIYAATDGQP